MFSHLDIFFNHYKEVMLSPGIMGAKAGCTLDGTITHSHSFPRATESNQSTYWLNRAQDWAEDFWMVRHQHHLPFHYHKQKQIDNMEIESEVIWTQGFISTV